MYAMYASQACATSVGDTDGARRGKQGEARPRRRRRDAGGLSDEMGPGQEAGALAQVRHQRGQSPQPSQGEGRQVIELLADGARACGTAR